jgi:hypothetical protein
VIRHQLYVIFWLAMFGIYFLQNLIIGDVDFLGNV